MQPAAHRRKAQQSAAPSAPASTNTSSPGPFVLAKPSGSFAPGNEQLAAVQVKHAATTLAMLTEGHSLYVGVCSGCHKVYSTYDFTEGRWTEIIDRMAPKARITEAQKDALSKYIFSMKATQPAGK